jgi:hypothetical protein
MSFFLRIKGCVNCCKTTSVYIKNAYSRAESFSHWERFLKITAPLSNLITPCFLNLTDLVSGPEPQWFLNPGCYGANLPSLTGPTLELVPSSTFVLDPNDMSVG